MVAILGALLSLCGSIGQVWLDVGVESIIDVEDAVRDARVRPNLVPHRYVAWKQAVLGGQEHQFGDHAYLIELRAVRVMLTR